MQFDSIGDDGGYGIRFVTWHDGGNLWGMFVLLLQTSIGKGTKSIGMGWACIFIFDVKSNDGNERFRLGNFCTMSLYTIELIDVYFYFGICDYTQCK